MKLFEAGTVLALAMTMAPIATAAPARDKAEMVVLPAGRTDRPFPLEKALSERRSVREFSAAGLRLAELAQLLWATQGATAGGAHRTAPSAGALYPLEVIVAAARVERLAAGVYRYDPSAHRLVRIAGEDRSAGLARAAYGQAWLREAPAILVITGVKPRTTGKYGERGLRYVFMEAGHAAQNALLQAVALGLGATVVGAFHDGEVQALLGLDAGESPLYLIPVGRPR